MDTGAGRSTQPSPIHPYPDHGDERGPRAPGYRYDVFVSFSPADAAWVEGWLLPRLERAGLVVCTPATCFEPGAPLATETERAIRESRRILAVLSPDWVAGHWSDFEAQLAHYRDPNAHTRRLIPLLLRPCEPPDRIRLLNWVDLTDEDSREAAVERVIRAIRGQLELPEIRVDLIPPPPVVWSRWIKLVGAVTLSTLVLVVAAVAGPWLPPRVKCALLPDPRMPDSQNSYNIAVAPFTPGETDRSADAAEQAFVRARDVANLIRSLAPEISDIVSGKPVSVWGPDQCVDRVAAGEAEARLAALDAHVLVYGGLYHVGGAEWRISPLFAIKNKEAERLAPELRGEHRLGQPIDYDAVDESGEGSVLSDRIQPRTKALIGLLRGLLFFAKRDARAYATAAEEFRKVAEDPAWGAAPENSGQEVLYLFLGSAYLKQATFAEDDPNERARLLALASEAFDEAIRRNPGYGRAWNGKGGTLLQIARPVVQPVALPGAGIPPPAGSELEDNRCDWRWEVLSQARDAYSHARDPALERPPSGFVDLRAELGLGLIGFYEGLCRDRGAWDDARPHLESVIARYDALGQAPGGGLDGMSAQPAGTGEPRACRRLFDGPDGQAPPGSGGGSAATAEEVERERDLVRLEAASAYTHLGNMALVEADEALVGGSAARGDSAPKLNAAIDNYEQAVGLALRSRSADGRAHVDAVFPFLVTAYCLAGQRECAAAAIDDYARTKEDAEGGKAILFARLDPALRNSCFH